MSTFRLSSKELKVVISWILWCLAVTFFVYEFFIRVSPSVLVESLITTFNTNDEVIGTLSALYFYIYAPMQFPVGLLMDRFGPKYLLPSAAFLCGMGALLFGIAPNIGLLSAGRLLMGFGSSFAFVGVLFITSRWLPTSRLALLIGIVNSAGMIGAFAGEGPISMLEESVGWRVTMLIIAAMGLLLAFFIYLLIHFAPEKGMVKVRKIDLAKVWKNLRKIFTHSQSWINALVGLLLYTPTAGFAGLWAVPFLMNNHNLSQNSAGFASSTIYLGWVVGGPLLGFLSDRLNTRRPFMKLGALCGLLCLTPVILLTNLPTPFIFILLTLVGLFSAAEILNFSFAIDLHPNQATGSAAAFTNFVIMMGGALTQPLSGWLLDLFWSGGMTGTVKSYSYGEYQIAMIIFPLCFLFAFFLAFFLHEKGDSKNKLILF